MLDAKFLKYHMKKLLPSEVPTDMMRYRDFPEETGAQHART
jgi:hypothetical protein